MSTNKYLTVLKDNGTLLIQREHRVPHEVEYHLMKHLPSIIFIVVIMFTVGYLLVDQAQSKRAQFEYHN